MHISITWPQSVKQTCRNVYTMWYTSIMVLSFTHNVILCIIVYTFAMWYCVCIHLHNVILHLHILNTLRPRQNGRHFADNIFKCIFLNENVWIGIKNSLKFVPKGAINNIPTLLQIMAWRRSGDKPLSESMLVSLPTHICIIRPQWVNSTLWYYISTHFHNVILHFHTFMQCDTALAYISTIYHICIHFHNVICIWIHFCNVISCLHTLLQCDAVLEYTFAMCYWICIHLCKVILHIQTLLQCATAFAYTYRAIFCHQKYTQQFSTSKLLSNL